MKNPAPKPKEAPKQEQASPFKKVAENLETVKKLEPKKINSLTESTPAPSKVEMKKTQS